MATGSEGRDPLARRELVTAVGGTTLAGLAGCTGYLPSLGGTQLSDLPPFAEGYAAIRTDATVDVRLRFDGDIQQQIEDSSIDTSELLTHEGIEFSPEPVTLEQTPEFQTQQTVEGVLNGFVEIHSNWPAADWYFTGLVSIADNVPIVDDSKFHVRFPTGYQYEFPAAQNRVENADGSYIDLNRADHRLLVSYGEETTYPKARTIPFIDHYDYAALVWMRNYAEYRQRLLNQMTLLFDWDTYADDALTALREGVSEIAAYLAENAVGSIVTAGLPSTQATAALSKVEDLRSIHEALTTEFTEFESALKSVETLTYASVNETWMSVLTPEDDEEAGLPRLAELSQIEWKVHNPVLATAHDPDQFLRHLTEYKALVNEQRAITQGILSDSRFTDISSFGDSEWRRLKQQAAQLVQRLDTNLAQEQSALETLRDEFN